MFCKNNLPRMVICKQIDPQKKYRSPEELKKAYLILEKFSKGCISECILNQMHDLREEIQAQFVFDSREYQ
jgi:hypothetical protein